MVMVMSPADLFGIRAIRPQGWGFPGRESVSAPGEVSCG